MKYQIAVHFEQDQVQFYHLFTSFFNCWRIIVRAFANQNVEFVTHKRIKLLDLSAISGSEQWLILNTRICSQTDALVLIPKKAILIYEGVWEAEVHVSQSRWNFCLITVSRSCLQFQSGWLACVCVVGRNRAALWWDERWCLQHLD